MRTVGITGPTGAGKTTALRAIEAMGGAVFDCDRIYEELLGSSAPMLAAIEGHFPGTVREGTLDRAKLADTVFSDPEALRDLSEITHPYVIREVSRRLREAEEAGREIAAIDAIGLFESGADRLCDYTVFVTAPLELRLRRVTERDGIDMRSARSRALAQRGDEYFEARCDYKLVNDFPDEEKFFQYCREFFQEDRNGGDQRRAFLHTEAHQ